MDAQQEIARYLANAKTLEDGHLYSPDQEHDACGVGFVAALDGKPRREVVARAIDALKAVFHRGAVDADGKTAMAAACICRCRREFFRAAVAQTGHTLRSGRIAVGQIFLPPHRLCGAGNLPHHRRIRNPSHRVLSLWLAAGADQPVRHRRKGQSHPAGDRTGDVRCRPTRWILETLDRRLYLCRRRIEKRVREASIQDFYICSLSSRSLIYKGMFLAEHLSEFYPDLTTSVSSQRSRSPSALFTNTFPTWRLAQPFRMLAHNGEINTLKGNVNWMKNHEFKMASQLFGEAGEDIKPIIQPGSSDSAALDSVFEVLVRAGRTAALAKPFSCPKPGRRRPSTMPESHRAMYAYANAVMEPWDGPAALAATDGRWVIAGMDRNGLRPQRYAITEDGLLFVGSEAGMVVLDESRISRKGRVGPVR